MLLGHLVGGAGNSAVLIIGLAICTLGALRLAGVGRRRVSERVGGILLVLGIVTATVGGTVADAIAHELRPVTTGDIRILSPTTGSTLATADVQVATQVSGFTLVDPTRTEPARSGKGHVHITVDGSVVAMVGSTKAVVCVPSGRHQIRADLVAADHKAFRNDPASAVTVEGASGSTC